MNIKTIAIFILFSISLTGISLSQNSRSFLLHDNCLPHTAESPYSLRMLCDKPPLTHTDTLETHHWAFDIDAIGYFVNGEYPMPFTKSFSVPGFRLSPAAVYAINDRALLRIGMTASYFAGSDSLHGLRPILSISYKPTDWLVMTAGTLTGSVSHQLDAPIYYVDNWVYDYSENGLQLLTSTKHWESDTWLNWRHFLEIGQPDQEYFTFGTRHDFALLPSVHLSEPCHAWQITIPMAFLANHRGGVTSDLDTNALTSFNEYAAFRISYLISQKSPQTSTLSSHRCTLEMPIYLHHLSSSPSDSIGLGFNPFISYQWQRISPTSESGYSLRTTIGYWFGNKYFDGILSTPQHLKNHWFDESRNMLSFAIEAEHAYRQLNIGLKFKIYHDFKENRNDRFYGFYIRFNGRWKS